MPAPSRAWSGSLKRSGPGPRQRGDANVANLLTESDHNKLVTALMKANGGKAVDQKQIDGAVQMMLLMSGSTTPLREPVQP
jgi:hypothetical protein